VYGWKTKGQQFFYNRMYALTAVLKSD